MKITWKILLSLAVVVLFTRGPRPSVAGSVKDSGFTGEAKAVLYVADVERSVPFFRDVLVPPADLLPGDRRRIAALPGAGARGSPG